MWLFLKGLAGGVPVESPRDGKVRGCVASRITGTYP